MEGLQGPKAEGNELDPVQAAAQPRVNRMPMGSALLVVLSHEDGDQQRKPCVAMPRREPETADADGGRSKEHAGAPIYVYTRGSCRRVIILSYTARGCDQPFRTKHLSLGILFHKNRAQSVLAATPAQRGLVRSPVTEPTILLSVCVPSRSRERSERESSASGPSGPCQACEFILRIESDRSYGPTVDPAATSDPLIRSSCTWSPARPTIPLC